MPHAGKERLGCQLLTMHQLCHNEEAVWLQAGAIELHDVAMAQSVQHEHLNHPTDIRAQSWCSIWCRFK